MPDTHWLKKENRDQVVTLLLDGLFVKKHEQVKIKKYSCTDWNFLSNALYRDPYFNFMQLLTKLINN